MCWAGLAVLLRQVCRCSRCTLSTALFPSALKISAAYVFNPLCCAQDLNSALKLEVRQFSTQLDLEKDALGKAARTHAAVLAEKETEWRAEVRAAEERMREDVDRARVELADAKRAAALAMDDLKKQLEAAHSETVRHMLLLFDAILLCVCAWNDSVPSCVVCVPSRACICSLACPLFPPFAGPSVRVRQRAVAVSTQGGRPQACRGE